jgi:hypothetical protein
MKMKNYFAAALATITAASLESAPFSAGSNGSLGVVVINADTTMDLPPDGRLHFITLTVNGGRTLRFNKNPLNTPVRILAQSNIVVAGTISVAAGSANEGAPGRGGPGGFDGGFGGYGNGANTVGGDGTGPGRGRNIPGSPHPYQFSAAFADPAGLNTRTNGNALNVPLMGGSGGAGNDGNPGRGGGGGGGAILLASDSKITLNGLIAADGGSGAGGGSGGSIRLVAPVIDGNGTFNVTGGGGFWAAGSQGRVRLDTEDRYAFRGLRFQGRVSQGSQMFVDPPSTPTLNITEAAGQVIPVPAVNGVQVTLPAGSSGSRQVKVAASGFTANVPITVVVTPETGASSSYDAEIPIADGNGQVTVDVAIPVGGVSQIHAWTR